MGWPEDIADRHKDRLRDAIGIFDHIRVPEAQHLPSQASEERGTLSIGRAIDVLTTVELDRQPRATAGQVEDVASDRELAGESRSIVR